ncbi:hypothetical protein WJ542_21735 [Paraburkholderia sp. B3]|uniref:hypothetical protein n=1 Tax=Paraburkholderia sp. B3 TaxID=3134791 RepID=UPI0039825613
MPRRRVNWSAGVTGDDRHDYSSFGAAGYIREVIADEPVRIGRQCYVGRLREANEAESAQM